MPKLIPFTTIALLLVLGCGVKSPQTGSEKRVLTEPGKLPLGVFSSANGEFLVGVSKLEMHSDPSLNSVVYRITHKDLVPVSNGILLKVKYWMPEMPGMPVTAPVVTEIEAGVVQVDYDVSMGGLWEFILDITNESGTLDTLKYQVTVPE